MFIIKFSLFIIFILQFTSTFGTAADNIIVLDEASFDRNGYIAYCPCMGRFGNQADQFLGSLAFAQHINRTLVLPPWVEYRPGELRSVQVPFDRYFQVDELAKYHRVILMDNFMENIAPHIWPIENRISFCYMERKSLNKSSVSTVKSCNAKEGNPFGPFWDTFNIDFVDSEFYGPLNYDVHHGGMASKWNDKYPANLWPVIAFTGAPATFPVQLENRDLQSFLIWTEDWQQKARTFIKTRLPKGSFLAIHLRNGVDWIRACEHTKDTPNLFAAPQCLGYQNEKGSLTIDICFPSRDIIIRQIKRYVKNVKEQHKGNEIKSIFVASDSNHMINELNDALQRMKIQSFHLNESNPHLDLTIMGMANHFIGNCVSSYTAFVKRERDAKGLPSAFWAFPTEKNYAGGKKGRLGVHEEL